MLFTLVGILVAGRSSSGSPSQLSSFSAAGGETEATNPLDQLSAADIAVNVAKVSNLPEATAVTNSADSANASLAVASTDDTVVSKPQIISDGLKSSKDIIHYKTVEGDTVANVAEKFGITSETIRLSNSLEGDNLNVGMELVISPVNGLVYRVQPNDTPESIAAKFHASKDKVIAFNDIELSGHFKPGQLIVVPNGVQPAGPHYSYSAARGAAPSSPVFSFGTNGYDYGWCTYYAAARSGAPPGWGNAKTWNIYAPLSGWTVSTKPKVGAIAQTSVGWGGHVGIVEAVSADGRMIKYSDMNGLAGFNHVGYSGWVPAIGEFQRFIYP